MISSIFKPHRHHEIMKYSPISLWMRKIRLRDIVNVYHKHNYCIQFQRKKGMNMRNRHFGLAKFEKCPKNVISSIFEPHRDHEIMRYSPISLWMRKIRLRDIVNVYLKHNYCIQFQRKKGINMRNRHFGLWQKFSKILQWHFSKKKSPGMGTKRLEMVWNVEKTYRENENFFKNAQNAQNVWMTSSNPESY